MSLVYFCVHDAAAACRSRLPLPTTADGDGRKARYTIVDEYYLARTGYLVRRRQQQQHRRRHGQPAPAAPSIARVAGTLSTLPPPLAIIKTSGFEK